MMNKIINFGENVTGYNIPVLNEREIRAAAGILFTLMLVSVMLASFKQNFVLLKFGITIFLCDIAMRVFVNPKFSPTLILGRWIVRNQVPEYVGAPQKKFAWIIGLVLSSALFTHVVLMNAWSPIIGLLCITCLLFLFFETAFGICLGCKLYPLFYREKVQYCPGEVCDVKSRQDIQKISRAQISIMFGFVALIIIFVIFMNDTFREKPNDLFGLRNHANHE